jgi:hypothetical protein
VDRPKHAGPELGGEEAAEARLHHDVDGRPTLVERAGNDLTQIPLAGEREILQPLRHLDR